ncbi:MAG: hypothetical protein QTN59_01920 [Candidatus Electrothrix communis]|nr:MAG: hypothetical protein QTN59_01920 [Candidatus Electrothrix communis]
MDFLNIFSAVFSLVAIIIAAIMTTLSFKDKKKAEEEKVEIEKEKKELETELQSLLSPMEHSFFVNIRYYIDNECWHSSCSESEQCKVQDYIINNMLRTKLSFWYCRYRNFFLQKEDFNIDSITEVIESIVRGYKKEWKHLGIPEKVYKAFNDRHDPRAAYIFEKMEEIFKNYKEGNIVKRDILLKQKFLDLSLTLLNITISDINSVVEGVVKKKGINAENIDFNKEYQNDIKNKNENEVDELCFKLFNHKIKDDPGEFTNE